MVAGKIEVLHKVKGEPWENYYALRVAVANESSICRALLRDKIHRPGSRRVVSPLGLVMDESERQTLICSNGSAFHRRVGNRFVDTLVALPGDTDANFSMSYGMDVPNPVNAAREMLCGPEQVFIDGSENSPEIGWLMHMSPRDLLVSELKIERCVNGRLIALVRLVQTRSQQCKASVRFLRDVDCAYMITGKLEGSVQEALASKQAAEKADNAKQQAEKEEKTDVSNLQPLTCEGDLVSLTMQSHANIEMVVVFAAKT